MYADRVAQTCNPGKALKAGQLGWLDTGRNRLLREACPPTLHGARAKQPPFRPETAEAGTQTGLSERVSPELCTQLPTEPHRHRGTLRVPAGTTAKVRTEQGICCLRKRRVWNLGQISCLSEQNPFSSSPSPPSLFLLPPPSHLVLVYVGLWVARSPNWP